MSQYSEIMDALTAQGEQLTWCTAALKHLLGQEVGWQPEALLGELDLDDEDDMSQYEHLAVRTDQPKSTACPHNQQANVNGNIICVRPNEQGVICGFVLTASGVRGKHPNSPVPAPGQEDRFNHISSNNTGSPLIPY